MSLPSLAIRLTGASPLICHNGQTADPQNCYAKAMKAISGKRKKVDSDYEELAWLEWQAGLYRYGNDLVIPDYVLESVFNNGAKKSRRGPQAKAGLFCTEHASLEFEGKPDVIDDDSLRAMYESGDFKLVAGVKVSMSKVMRTRPIFRKWSCKATVQFDPDVLNLRDIDEIVRDAGRLVGVGDWRPKHGRFDAVVAPVGIPESLAAELIAIAG